MKKLLLFVLLVGLSVGTQAQSLVTFAVDMNNEAVSENGVHIAGTVQSLIEGGADWTPGTTPMADLDEDGIYTITIELPAGDYQYKYVNGNVWGFDETAITEACGVDDGLGGGGFNRIVSIGEADTVIAFTFNTCDEVSGVTGIEELEIKNTAVAYPNPSHGKTTISYSTDDEEVSLTIYNLVGQVVKVLANDFHQAGTHEVLWDGTTETGGVAPTGQYFYVLESANAVTTKSLLMVR